MNALHSFFNNVAQNRVAIGLIGSGTSWIAWLTAFFKETMIIWQGLSFMLAIAVSITTIYYMIKNGGKK